MAAPHGPRCRTRLARRASRVRRRLARRPKHPPRACALPLPPPCRPATSCCWMSPPSSGQPWASPIRSKTLSRAARCGPGGRGPPLHLGRSPWHPRAGKPCQARHCVALHGRTRPPPPPGPACPRPCRSAGALPQRVHHRHARVARPGGQDGVQVGPAPAAQRLPHLHRWGGAAGEPPAEGAWVVPQRGCRAPPAPAAPGCSQAPLFKHTMHLPSSRAQTGPAPPSTPWPRTKCWRRETCCGLRVSRQGRDECM